MKARLATMLQAVNGVSDALDDFEADLSDEQKAGFEAMGPKRGVRSPAPPSANSVPA